MDVKLRLANQLQWSLCCITPRWQSVATGKNKSSKLIKTLGWRFFNSSWIPGPRKFENFLLTFGELKFKKNSIRNFSWDLPVFTALGLIRRFWKKSMAKAKFWLFLETTLRQLRTAAWVRQTTLGQMKAHRQWNLNLRMGPQTIRNTPCRQRKCALIGYCFRFKFSLILFQVQVQLRFVSSSNSSLILFRVQVQLDFISSIEIFLKFCAFRTQCPTGSLKNVVGIEWIIA